MDEVKLLPCALKRVADRLSKVGQHGYVTMTVSDLRVLYEAAIAAWNTRAIEATRPTEQDLERVAREIEQYGEGLVPELRIVCTWLAAHFRNDDDARAAIAIVQDGG